MCENSETKTDLEMYFTVNLAFVNYFDKALEELGIPTLRNWTTKEHILLFSIKTFEINPNLFNAPKTLKDLINQYKTKRKYYKYQNAKMKKVLNKDSNFGTFLNSFLAEILLSSVTLGNMIITSVVIYMICVQSILKALQCVKVREAADVNDMFFMCKIQWYIIGMLLIVMLGMLYLATNKIKRPSLFKG